MYAFVPRQLSGRGCESRGVLRVAACEAWYLLFQVTLAGIEGFWVVIVFVSPFDDMDECEGCHWLDADGSLQRLPMHKGVTPALLCTVCAMLPIHFCSY